MKPYYQIGQVSIYQGDVRQVLPGLLAESVNCVVTSPPYWGLRDYGTAKWEGGEGECDHSTPRSRGDDIRYGDKQGTSAGSRPNTQTQCKCGAIRIDSQLGLERTPDEYISNMVALFREVRRVLRSDGTLWLNMGDSYCSINGRADGKTYDSSTRDVAEGTRLAQNTGILKSFPDLKPKDLCGIPWLLAFALRSDGWYLRQDIIWAKPNPMPESVTDRCTKAHEYIFLLSKSERYFYDADAVREPYAEASLGRYVYALQGTAPTSRQPGGDIGRREREKAIRPPNELGRNKRSVWTVTTQSFEDAHFATFPEELIKPCILAGCPAGGTVLDPFFGSGTTGLVARANGCKCIGVELNPEYIEIAAKRLSQEVLDFSQ